MPTSTTVDHGDYTETITGEPAWDSPTVWRTSSITWKPGTPQYERQQALVNLQNLLPQLGPALAQAQTDAANYPNLSAVTDRQTVIARLINNTSLIAQGVDYLLKHLQIPGA